MVAGASPLWAAARVPLEVAHMDATPFADDLARVKTFLAEFGESDKHERTKIFWRGDRIEWLLARGYHGWLMGEIAAERVLWPGLGVPRPRLAAHRAV